jgi:hypothetical protein
MQQNHLRAKDALEQVLLARPPAPIARAVRRLLAKNEAAMRRNQVQTELGGKVLFGWDSNANLGGKVDDGKLDPNLLGLTDLADTSQAVDSAYVQWSLYTGVQQPTSQTSYNHFRLDFTSKNYLEPNIADTNSVTGLANLHLQYDRMRYLLPLSTKLSWREGQLWKSSTALGVTPQYRVWGPLWMGVNIATEFDLAIDDREKTTAEDSVGIEIDAKERQRRHQFSSHFLQSRLSGQKNTHLEWRALANAYQLNWQLPWKMSAMLSIEHQWRYYKQDDPFFTVNSGSSELKRRQDQLVDGLFNASWLPAPWLQTSLIVEWHQVASNINAYSHKQWLASSAINIHF